MQEQVEEGANDDGTVGKIEGWPAVELEVDIEKIDDVASGNAVDGVADDACAHQAEADLEARVLQFEGISEKPDKDEDGEGEADEHPGQARKHSPCRTIIDGVDEIKVTRNDRQSIKGWIEPLLKAGPFDDGDLAELIGDENRCEADPEQAVSH
mgnify:CR=1 FL=1